MTHQPLVSILIPAYNAQKWIAEAINSALAQTWSNIEIIIVNDGSSDSTLDILKKMESEHKNILVINQENKGAAGARNMAFQQSKGQYIQYLDADDLLDFNKIEIQMKFIFEKGDDYLYSSEWGMFYNNLPNENTIIENKLKLEFYPPVEWLITAWTKKVWMQPTAWLIPRALIEKAGSWNEKLSLHDDGEFFCRVILNSKGVIFCPNAKSYYRKGIENSLSSQVSEKAVISHLTICNLYTQHLLNKENSKRTKLACAGNFQNFIYTYYPFYSKYTRLAKLEIKKLGGSNLIISGGPIFSLFVKIAGWKTARLIQLLTTKIKHKFTKHN
jgi:glycosyltransferase involved in cell wall biosynthesis